jgi:hypothetical protein
MVKFVMLCWVSLQSVNFFRINLMLDETSNGDESFKALPVAQFYIA